MFRLVGIIGLLSLMACKSEPTRTEVYSVLFDRTDSLIATPSSQELEGFTGIKNTSKTIVLRYAEISDVDYNKVSQLIRPNSQNGLLSNAVKEKRKQDAFTKEFKALFSTKNSVVPTEHSSIFQSILNEVYHLEAMPKINTRSLIVYSDLMENTLNGISFYKVSDLKLLFSSPEKIALRLLSQVDRARLPKTPSTKVYVVYIPTDNGDNNRYKQLQEVYRLLFKELNITISFTANLTNATYQL